MVLAFSLSLVPAKSVMAGSNTITLDSFDSEGTPLLEGQLTTDGENLFLEVRADPMAVSGNNAYLAWLIYAGDTEPAGFSGPWDDAYLLNDNWFTAGPQGNVQWGVGSSSTHPWSAQGALPSGVELEYETDGDEGIWAMTVPFAAIGVEMGDTISYMVQARYHDLDTGETSLNQSHGSDGFNPLWFSDNYQVVTLELPPIEATVTIHPETLNVRAQGKWITAYIELPAEYAVEDINIETVQLLYNNESLDAEWGNIQNGVFMFKFDRETVAGWFDGLHDEEVALTVVGEANGNSFEGTATIRVIDPVPTGRGRL